MKQWMLFGLLVAGLGQLRADEYSDMMSAMALPHQILTTVEPHALVEKKSPGEWSVLWWQWATRMNDNGQDAISDTNGAYAASFQSGPVWFLAGSYYSAKVQRVCKVPQGKYIFFPLTCHVDCEGYDNDSMVDAACLTAEQDVVGRLNGASGLFCSVNDIPVPDLSNHREASPSCFWINELDARRCSSDGYWIMFEPPKPGDYKIHFGGSHEKLSNDIEYQIHVE
jgi:hypothetical protein